MKASKIYIDHILNKKGNIVQKRSNLKEILQYIPIVYPILIFLGFINYDFYYKRFDIEIFNYLSINELLFSFISLIYPIIFLLVGQLAINVYNDLIKGVNKKEDTENIMSKSNSKNKLEKSFYKKKYIKAKQLWKDKNRLKSIVYFLLTFLFIFIYGLALILPYIIIWIGYMLIISPLFRIISLDSSVIKSPGILNSPSRLLIVTLAWYFTYAFYIGLRYSNNEISKKSSRFLLYSVGICLLITSLLKLQDINAYDFYIKEPKRHVSFDYEERTVKTDSNTRVIGITAHYIFLRNIDKKTNQIYRLDNVRDLKISNSKIE